MAAVRPATFRDGGIQPLLAGDTIDPVYLPAQSEAEFVAAFSYGDANPALIASLPAGRRVALAQIDVATAFNGIGAALSIGTLGSPGSIMPADDNDPRQVCSYSTTPMQTATDIYLFITPGSGATAGAGHVLIKARA